MEFTDEIKQFAQRISKIAETIQTEEATKMSMVVPFFQVLNYDILNETTSLAGQ